MGHTEEGPAVHAICGLVCAGKTTLAKKLASELDAVRFTLDEWMLRLYGLRHDDPAYADRIQGCQDLIWEMARQVLVVGHPVILDWNHWSRERRAASRDRAEAAGYRYILHWLDVPLETAVARARARSAAQAPHAHDIDEDGVRFFATIFQPPDADEGVVVDHIRVPDPLRDS